VIGRLRALLKLDSAICLIGGVAVIAFAAALADRLGVDNSVAVRFVGVFLVVYGSVLALLARAKAPVVKIAGRLTALADASWVLGTVALVAVGVLSAGGDIIVAVAAIPVAALGVAKVAALRSSPGGEAEHDETTVDRTDELVGFPRRR
jgi:hypothetical protein